jgi:acyl-CoA hydrolase
MDRAAEIQLSARRHFAQNCDPPHIRGKSHVAFNRAIALGVSKVKPKLSRSFNTSMEIFIDVWIEDHSLEKT